MLEAERAMCLVGSIQPCSTVVYTRSPVVCGSTGTADVFGVPNVVLDFSSYIVSHMFVAIAAPSAIGSGSLFVFSTCHLSLPCVLEYALD
jgi:hypothetical protein